MCTWRLCCYICQKHFIMLMSYFFFFLLMHYTAFLMAIKCGFCLQGNLLIMDFLDFKQNIKGDKTTSIFRINTGKTLCKLHWNSKIPLQRNGIAAIPKIYFLHRWWKCKNEHSYLHQKQDWPNSPNLSASLFAFHQILKKRFRQVL